tara:strand:- start:1423 stop:2124 length:702 start_codon:yes stop_codon:yes gene_type:complete
MWSALGQLGFSMAAEGSKSGATLLGSFGAAGAATMPSIQAMVKEQRGTKDELAAAEYADKLARFTEGRADSLAEYENYLARGKEDRERMDRDLDRLEKARYTDAVVRMQDKPLAWEREVDSRARIMAQQHQDWPTSDDAGRKQLVQDAMPAAVAAMDALEAQRFMGNLNPNQAMSNLPALRAQLNIEQGGANRPEVIAQIRDDIAVLEQIIDRSTDPLGGTTGQPPDPLGLGL